MNYATDRLDRTPSTSTSKKDELSHVSHLTTLSTLALNDNDGPIYYLRRGEMWKGLRVAFDGVVGYIDLIERGFDEGHNVKTEKARAKVKFILKPIDAYLGDLLQTLEFCGFPDIACMLLEILYDVACVSVSGRGIWECDLWGDEYSNDTDDTDDSDGECDLNVVKFRILDYFTLPSHPSSHNPSHEHKHKHKLNLPPPIFLLYTKLLYITNQPLKLCSLLRESPCTRNGVWDTSDSLFLRRKKGGGKFNNDNDNNNNKIEANEADDTSEENSARNTPKSLPLAMALNYKSHWAYYTFVRYQVLGTKVKLAKKNKNKKSKGVVCLRDIFGFDSLTSSDDDDDLQKSFRNFYASRTTHSDDAVMSNKLTNIPPIFSTSISNKNEHENEIEHDEKVLYLIGDSHTLSLNYVSLNKLGVRCRSLPATGLKASHLKVFDFSSSSPSSPTSPSTSEPTNEAKKPSFHTFQNLTLLLNRLPTINLRTLVLTAGEIDCREGFGGVVLKELIYLINCKSRTQNRRMKGGDEVHERIEDSVVDDDNGDVDEKEEERLWLEIKSVIKLRVKSYIVGVRCLRLYILHIIKQRRILQQNENKNENERSENESCNILLTPVCPPIKKAKDGSGSRDLRCDMVECWNTELFIQLPSLSNSEDSDADEGLYLLNYYPSLINATTTVTVNNGLKVEFNADFTHMNNAFRGVFEDAIIGTGIDL